MYDLFLPPGLKGTRRFPASYEFLANFIETWIKFGFEEKRKGIPHTQAYFQRGCINILQKAFFFFFKKKKPYGSL